MNNNDPNQPANGGAGVLRSVYSAGIVGLCLYAVAWVNKRYGGKIAKRFGLNPSQTDKNFQNWDRSVNKGTTPKSGAKFLDNVDKIASGIPQVKDFFKGTTFIEDLAQKAVYLQEDPNTAVDNGLLKKLISVSLYQQVIYCDDSSSMRRYGRFDSQKELAQRIARIGTLILPEGEGVALRFINQALGGEDNNSNLDLGQIVQILAPLSHVRNGDTEIGTYLRSKILEPMVYRYLDSKTLKRPLLISVITDGQPEGELEEKNTFIEAIVECAEKLEAAGYHRENVKFLVGQIGTATSAKRFLENIRDAEEIADMVYCTSDQLDAELARYKENEKDLDRWLIELLFSPIKGEDDEGDGVEEE
ncbi:hypothetical protein TWF506_004432 [Arthrobotrys conoides]|uniref:VWFA domain-containing protein n=1 Tax=Arthrobotrys conoides TaxID=74498 RepID=A0AAN8N338_9PEZI